MVDLKTFASLLATGTEGIAAVLIAAAAIEAAIRSVLVLLRIGVRAGSPQHDEKEAIRLKLGRWLALALEFELGADILRTAVAPTWNEIGLLAAIAVLRTALNFFLQQEIDKAEAREAARAAAPPGPASHSIAG